MSRTGLVPVLEFDVGACVSLHNKIVHAAHQSHPNVSVVRGYFNYYSEDRGNIDGSYNRPFLSDSMVECLDGTGIINDEKI